MGEWISDSQRLLVYSWEGEWPAWNVKNLDKDNIESAVEWSHKIYRLPPPKVEYRASDAGETWYDGETHVISVSQKARNAATILHEAAHSVHTLVTGDNHEHHGPEWLAVYLWLLQKYGIASRRALLLSAKAIGLEFRPLVLHSPRRLKNTYRAMYRVQKAEWKKSLL